MVEATRNELVRGGYGALNHNAVAVAAGVARATVCRRWPTRAILAMDSLRDLARIPVALPDTGSMEGDLESFLEAIALVLEDPSNRRLLQALGAAEAEDPALREYLREFWTTRFASAAPLIERAAERGELPPDTDPENLLERLVAPVYFRALVSGGDIDAGFRRNCVALALLECRREIRER